MDHNHLLWDDTVAGPKPDHRNIPAARKKKNMFRPSLSLILDPVVDVVVVGPVITRSITILKPNSSSSSSSSAATPTTTTTTSHLLDSLSSSSSSVPSSPVGSFSSSPSSPFSPRTPQFDSKGLLTRRKPPAAMTTMKNKSSSSVVYEPRTPTVYDWVVISALDR